FAAFWQVDQFEFINFDDNVYVSENVIVQSGLTKEGFLWAFSTKYFGLWNPLVWLSFMADYQLYGLNAGGYHVTNLIFHILSALLLFWLFHRMTGEIWKSAFVAAFFALHPLHVESVAWISERKDVLSAFFWMLTLCFYVVYTEKQSIQRYLLVVFSFVLALLSKPMVVTLPLIMILLDYWPLKRFENQNRLSDTIVWQLKEKLPLMLLSLLLVVATFYTPGDNASYELLPLQTRLANAPVAFVTYLAKTFWPQDMAIFYPFPSQIPVWQITGAILLIATVTAAVIMTVKRLPHLFVGWFWFIITIAPVIGILQIGDFAMADRYHYLPSIGIGAMLAWGIPHCIKREDRRKNILWPVAIVSLIVLSVLTWEQSVHWKNNIELWNHAIQVTEDNYMAHNNLASALLEKGETEKAMHHYHEAIAINHYPAAYYNIGVIYYRMGQHQQSIEYFKKAIREKADYAAAYFNLGIVYQTLGLPQQALEQYNEATRLLPAHANAYNNKAFIFLNAGNNLPGCANAQKACKLGNCRTLIWAQEKGICN
ncbi:MAG TPA: tetratricopeptide repeat protein, partial [Paludibacter sp.]|nr:tetratricopeptide repeat protein [Paludibacter sp.]